MNYLAKPLKILVIFTLSITVFACSKSSNEKSENPVLKNSEGFIPVKGGNIWYGIMGNGDKTPLLCLHGGPGGTHRSYFNLSETAKERPVIMFDQLGTGRSDHHQDTALLKVDLLVEQVKAVKEHLNLNEFYLAGGSWGAALALEYYTKYPEGIKGILFNSPYFSTKVWTQDADILIGELPDSTQQAIRQAEKDSVFNTESYLAANDLFASKHGRRKPLKKHAYDTIPFEWSEFIYNHMWGPSEFTATGTLKTYDNLESLKTVNVPVLFTTGQYDEARPETVQRFHEMVKGSLFVEIADAGHNTLNDNTEAMNKAIQEFIQKQEKDEVHQ